MSDHYCSNVQYMRPGDGIYWIEVDGVKYVFRNHYLSVSDVYEAVEAILAEWGPPVKLLDECPPFPDRLGKRPMV